MTPEQIAISMFVLLIMAVMTGHPITFTVAGIALLFGITWWGGYGVLDLLAKNIYGAMSNYLFAAIPSFLFMGAMLEYSGIGEALYSAMHIVMGRIRGGLASATVFICTIFAAATGIIATSLVSMGLIALPAMLKRGYSKPLATGATMAGACLGILIPPSIMLIVIAASAGLSVGKLFAAAIFPGLILSGLYMTMITVLCFFRPQLGPAIAPERVISLTKKLKLTLTALVPPVGLIIAVLGSIFIGLASPTEAAAVGAFGSILIAAGYRKLNSKVIKNACYETMISCGMVFWIIVGANCYAAVFLGLGGGEVVKALFLGMAASPLVILLTILLVIFLLGMIIEWIAIVLIGIPLFFPIVTTLGFDPLWFAMLFAITLQTGFLTPPYGSATFILKGIAPKEVTMGHIWRGSYLFVPLQLIGLALCIKFSQLILWLPSVLVK